MHYCLMRHKDNYIVLAKALNPDRQRHEFTLLAERYKPGRVLGQGKTNGDALSDALELAAAARVHGRVTCT